MFNQSKGQAVAKEDTQPKSKKSNGRAVPSLFGSDVILKGDLVSDGEIQFDGRLTGTIRAGSVIVGKDAVINGEIIADSMKICGTIKGSMHARSISLLSTCKVEGEILHSEITIEAGAYFEGHCHHTDTPFAKKQDKSAGTLNGSTPQPDTEKKTTRPRAVKEASAQSSTAAA